MDEENPHLRSWDDRPGGEDERVEEDEDDYAPLPPEMIAASFEEAKPKLIEDNDDASVPPSQIAFEGHGDEEERMEEAEDDYAPLPLEMIAASLEEAKPKLIEDNVDASAPPEQIALSLKGHGDEEEKVEEDEDEYAPLPPEMRAASLEEAKPTLIEDNVDASAPPKQIAFSLKGHGDEEEKVEEDEDEYAPIPPEMITASFEAAKPQLIEDNDDAFASPFEGLGDEEEKVEEAEDEDRAPLPSEMIASSYTDFSSLSHLQPSIATKDYVDAVSRSHQSPRSNDISLSDSNQGHVDFDVYLNPEVTSGSHPSLDPSHQSLPLLEATLVHDLPEEPVYDAFPIDSTLDNDSHGWSVRARKYRFIISGLVFSAVAATIAVAVVVSSDNKYERNEPISGTDTSLTTTTSTTISINTPPHCPLCLWKKQEEAIIGTDVFDTLGWAVALSADEKTLVVGAPGVYHDDIKTGHVEVYHRDNNTELVQTIHGMKAGDLFGYSVDIAANGTILAIGSPGNGDKKDRPGYVSVYHRESSDDLGLSWKKLGQDITGEIVGAEFGRSISLSDDGRTLAVVAERNNGTGQDGLVRIYLREDDSTSWKQLGEDIEGEELSLSGDGKTIAIGAPWNDKYGQDTGCVKVYQLESEQLLWKQLGDTLSGEANGDLFGWFVDISTDGTILVTGSAGYLSYDRVGFVRVYRLELGDDLGVFWKKLGKDITGEDIGDEFGSSGFLSNDGTAIAVAAYDNTGGGKGHVGVYRIDNSSLLWTQQGENIMDDAAEYFRSRSTSLSLSGDGKTVVIGNSEYNGNGIDSGLVRIFTKEY